MNCVNCSFPMIAVELDRVEIDSCPQCESIWMDEGELEILMEGAEAAVSFLDSFAAPGKASDGQKKCPICLTKMSKFVFEGTGGVHLDACPKKHGIWCDRGELKEILLMQDSPTGSKLLQWLGKIYKST